MAYYTYEQLLEKIHNMQSIYFVIEDCNIVEFKYNGSYRISCYNITSCVYDKVVNQDEFNSEFFYYLTHYKMGGAKNGI